MPPIMSPSRFRTSLFALSIAWFGIVAFVGHLLISAEIARHERRFGETAQQLASELKNKLDMNEAVLAGFAAFLRAVEGNDVESATRYAASAIAAYPHVYMLEVARRVPVAEEEKFQAALRREWLSSFTLKNFPGRKPASRPGLTSHKETWPILFMYPSLPEAQEIYGVRLETVDFLSQSLVLAQNNANAVVSPVFQMFEGGSAYILLKEVERATPASTSAAPNLFGNTMTAMLLVKTEALLSHSSSITVPDAMAYSAEIRSASKANNLLFSKAGVQPGKLASFYLPRFEQESLVGNASQPTVMHFEHQLSWHELLTREFLLVLGLLACALLTVPTLSLRHFRALERGAREHERSAYLATHDLLTGLPNRFLFMDRFEQAVQQHIRNGNAFALLLLDIDHFKEINDQFGHEVGDAVLVESAQRMKREIRACDTVARQGGDEFVILLANALTPDDAVKVGDKLRAAIAQPQAINNDLLNVTCSIGVAMYPSDGQTLDTLRRAADQAMYDSKRSGRNTVSAYRQSPATSSAPALPA